MMIVNEYVFLMLTVQCSKITRANDIRKHGNYRGDSHYLLRQLIVVPQCLEAKLSFGCFKEIVLVNLKRRDLMAEQVNED